MRNHCVRKYHRVLLVTLFCLAAWLQNIGHCQNDAITVFKRVAPTVVRLFNSTSTGTGVVLTSKGMILTNAHVVSSPLPFQCTVEVLKGGKRQTVTFKKVQVTKIHKSMDLAIVQIDPAEHDCKLASCKLGKEKNPVGQRLYAIGNPATEDNGVLNKTITEGLLSGVDRLIEGVKYYQISAAINPGNSGGPICDSSGTVVGIVTLKQSDVEGVGFAIPVFDIKMADFESYRRKTISAAKAKELLRKAAPLLEQVRLESNRENNNKGSKRSLGLLLKRAILFQICQEAAHYDPNNPEVFTQLGLVCFLQQEFEAAQAYMLESIRLNAGQQSRPYELLSKSLSQQNREPESVSVDFEMLGKFSQVGHLWQYVGTKLYAKGLRKEGCYLLLHSIAAAKKQGDLSVMRESSSRYTNYSRDMRPEDQQELRAITPSQVERNLARIKEHYRAADRAKFVLLEEGFADFLEKQTGTRLSVASKPIGFFSLLQPDQETLAEARVAKYGGRFKRSIQLAERLTNDNDRKIQRAALMLVGDAYQKWGMYLYDNKGESVNKYFYQSADFYRKVDKEHAPFNPTEKREFAYVLYNEACSFALEGQKTKAIRALRESFEEGFPNPQNASEDKDFASLHSDSEFRRLVSEFSRRR